MFAVSAARSSCTTRFRTTSRGSRRTCAARSPTRRLSATNRPAGRMPAVWAMERLMDDAARKLNMSPAADPQLNLVQEVSLRIAARRPAWYAQRLRLHGHVRRAAEGVPFRRAPAEVKRLRAAGRRVGIGIATCVETCRPLCSIGGVVAYNQPQYASVTLRMYPDGSVSIRAATRRRAR